jgi:hypothetical protein
MIEENVLKPPHIVMISRGVIEWGGDKWFKNAAPYIHAGMKRNAGLTEPDLGFHKHCAYSYGTVFDWPPKPLINIINNVAKTRIINACSQDKDFDYLSYLYSRGFINSKTGKRDPARNLEIYVRFFFMRDPIYRPIQQTWLSNQDLYIRKQWRLAGDLFRQTVMGQVESGRKKQAINKQVLYRTEYLELNSGVSDDEIDWIVPKSKAA